MSNPSRTIYPVCISCLSNGKYESLGNDFVTENMELAFKEVDRLVRLMQTAYAHNDYSKESTFINSHLNDLENIYVDMFEITPNGESTHLKKVKVFSRGRSRNNY